MPCPSDWKSPFPLDAWRELNRTCGENPPAAPPALAMRLMHPLISCGPILRLAGTWEKDTPNYRGLVLLVYTDIDSSSVPVLSYVAGSYDGERISEGSFPSTVFHIAKNYTFVRYAIDLPLLDHSQRVRYFIDEDSFNTFHVPSTSESMNIVSVLCNGFSLGADPQEYPSSQWLDVLTKHTSSNTPYHVMIGGGDQIYADLVKLKSPELAKWLTEKSAHRKRSMPATPQLEQELEDYYLEHYMAWFGSGFWEGLEGTTLQGLFPVAMAQIPLVNIYDDHDIIDGYGLYDERTMLCPVFRKLGNIAYRYYMLFQHHILPDEPSHTEDPAWILGARPGPSIAQKSHLVYARLGREIALAAFDCRTERTLKQVVSPESYKLIFDRVNLELNKAPDVKHLLVLLGVPIFYPRLVWLERLLNSSAIVPLRKLAQHAILPKGLVNEFDGAVEVLDDLNDHWCSHHHKKERNALVRDLINLASSRGVRITILLGDVHLGCIGRVKLHYHKHRKTHQLLDGQDIGELNDDVTDHPERDPRLIFNVISLAIMNAPPPDAMPAMLMRRSRIHKFDRDTDEDILSIFETDVDGSPLQNRQFLNRRNWCDLIIASQSEYSTIATEKASLGVAVEKKIPAPVLDRKQQSQPDLSSNVEIAYPLYQDSLVTTLRMEQDQKDFTAPSVGYELLIPSLVGKYKLSQSKIKHL